MNNNHISLFVELSDKDKLLEQKLEKQIIEVRIRIDVAIEQQKPYKRLRDLEEKIYCSIKDLKGGVFAGRGQKMPKNSTELAKGILVKAQKVAYLELEYIDSQLDVFRNELHSIKARIESIILFSVKNKLDEKFDDFRRIIKIWENEKDAIFNNPERCEPAFGIDFIYILENNLIGYYIQKLTYLRFDIGALNYSKTNRTQVTALISICEIVIVSEDDNKIYDLLFMMGQRAGNLNSIELGIKAKIAKDISTRSSASKSDWTHELAQCLYLNHWLHNEYPSTSSLIHELETGKYRHLKEKKDETKAKVNEKTMERVIREQRKMYSMIDPRITLPQKGRPKNLK